MSDSWVWLQTTDTVFCTGRIYKRNVVTGTSPRRGVYYLPFSKRWHPGFLIWTNQAQDIKLRVAMEKEIQGNRTIFGAYFLLAEIGGDFIHVLHRITHHTSRISLPHGWWELGKERSLRAYTWPMFFFIISCSVPLPEGTTQNQDATFCKELQGVMGIQPECTGTACRHPASDGFLRRKLASQFL